MYGISCVVLDMNIKAIKSAAVYSNDCTCIFSGILKDWYQTLCEAAVYR